MLRLDPSAPQLGRYRLPRTAERAIREACRAGATLADIEAIGGWMERAEHLRTGRRWLEDWSAPSVLDRHGDRWRERLAEATGPPKRNGHRGPMTFAEIAAELVESERINVIDVGVANG